MTGLLSQAQVRRAIERGALAQRQQAITVRTLQAPIGGLNGRDDIADMKEDDARRLDNWFPDFGKVVVRGGTQLWGTVGSGDPFVAETDPVETLARFEGTASEKLLAAAGGAIYDVTAGSDQATALASGFTNNRWQHANMLGKLGLVNGDDTPQSYDGSTLGNMTIDEKSGEPALDVADLIDINVFKSRSYFIAKNSQDFWYSALNALGGDLELFPLGDVGSFGGHLVTMLNWTRDGGSGMDDLAVFCMSSGEAIVYQGSDPGSANDWSLVGVFPLGKPVGRRAWSKIGGDIVLATADGYVLLSRVLPGGRGAPGTKFNDKIGKFATNAVRDNGTDFGWSIIHYPRGSRLLINHPAATGFAQHVINLGTGAWCTFRDMDARCWSLFGERLFFGTAAGQIVEADTGTSDQGANINAECDQAYKDLTKGSRNAQVSMVLPLLEASGGLEIEIGLSADYNARVQKSVAVEIGQVGGGGAQWDVAQWDEAQWGEASKTAQRWIPHAALGYAIAPSLAVRQKDVRISWTGTRIAYRPVGQI